MTDVENGLKLAFFDSKIQMSMVRLPIDV